MTKGTALYHLWNLEAEALEHGSGEEFVNLSSYVDRIDLTNIETVGGLIEAIEIKRLENYHQLQ
jgi:hypothetical protein